MWIHCTTITLHSLYITRHYLSVLRFALSNSYGYIVPLYNIHNENMCILISSYFEMRARARRELRAPPNPLMRFFVLICFAMLHNIFFRFAIILIQYGKHNKQA